MNQPGSLEILDLEAMGLEDFDISCDYAGRSWAKCDGTAPAKWIVRMHCSDCRAGAIRLLCTICKDWLLETREVLVCPECSAIWSPFRSAIKSIQPLDKGKT